MKHITLFFDLEGFWEAPYKGSFDEEQNVRNIINVLNKYNAKAVFNTCGVIGEFWPEIIKQIAKDGHEIASHGHKHENFLQLKKEELNKILEKTEKIIYALTNQRIIGLRCPWLLHNEMVYEVAKERGYKWVSNKYFPFPELFSNPGSKTYGVYKLAKLSLKFQHLFFKKEPYNVDGLLEIPLTSSLENDLLGLMNCWQESPKDWLDYAYDSLIKQFNRSGRFFNLNMHPWIIGSANRPELLDRILKYITKEDVKFVLAKSLVKMYN
ncbi:MAG: polysaccharide deacetylase family protein [Nanoarchaeota archaeon]